MINCALSASRTSEITNILEHDTSFALRLFPVANGALFAKKVVRISA